MKLIQKIPLIFKHFGEMSLNLPTPVFCVNTDGVIWGANPLALNHFDCSSDEYLIGKTLYDLFPEKMADSILKHNQEVIRTGRILTQNETLLDQNGKKWHFYAKKSLLKDPEGNLMGVVIMPMKFDFCKELFFQDLKKIIDLIPTPVYWVDINSVALGVNSSGLSVFGLSSDEYLIGKTPYELYPKSLADKIVQHNNQIIKTGTPLSQEETIIDLEGSERHFVAIKSPMFDDEGNCIGLIGTSIEITNQKNEERLRLLAEKDAENLKLENARQLISLTEKEKFGQVASQVAHDIRSPLSCLMMLAKNCVAIPEKERTALRVASTRISDIANNLISNYKPEEAVQSLRFEEREPFLVSPVLLQILTEKKYQYQQLPVLFEHYFTRSGEFSWINVQPVAFTRMVSNIINNAVDSFDQKEGKIKLHLDADDDRVSVKIEDDGKGMSSELVQKIMSQIAVTEGKKDGHGIGLTQVRETLQNNHGQWNIESQIGSGTKIQITFQRAQPLGWIADTIELNCNDMIVILDDDSSIHMAWDLRFEEKKNQHPELTIKHFEVGQEAIDLINGFSQVEKNEIFLLADYELINQNLNGLDVIEMTQVKRSVLVTSHYSNKHIQGRAMKLDTKILPKELASDIPINFSNKPLNCDAAVPGTDSDLKNVDVIFVDDEQYLLDGFKMFAFDKQVDTFNDPQNFLDTVNQYHKHTKIMLDQNYANSPLKGREIAEKLHLMGFTRLYLLSGENFSTMQFPHYLTAVSKTDLDSLGIALNT